MRRRLLALRLAALLLVAASGLAAAAPPVLLVDHSGSMTGFHRSRALPELVRMLHDEIGDDPEVLWTVSDAGDTRLVAGEPPAEFGSETRLNESLHKALPRRPSAVWLLTDNVPSSEQPDRDLDKLYEWLRRDGAPYEVDLFVLKLPFEGTLYRADGTTHLTDSYVGDRALVLYGALLDETQHDAFTRSVDRVRKRLEENRPQAVLPLRCKPLNIDAVAMEVADGSMKLGPDRVLEGEGREGEVFRGNFFIRLRSKMPHVYFSNVRPTFTASPFQTTDFDTREVVSSLAERNMEKIGEGWQGIEATLSLQPVRLERTLSSASKAFAKGKEPGILEGYLTLALRVDRRSVVIVPEDVQRFSTDGRIFEDPSASVQSRIYRLQELFKGKFANDSLEIHPSPEPSGLAEAGVAGRVPVRIRMHYSPASAFVLLGYVLGPLLAVGAFLSLAFAAYRARFRCDADGFDGRPFRIVWTHAVSRSAGPVGTLFHLAPFLWFTAAPGWTIGTGRTKRLSRNGGTVVLKKRSGEELSLRFVRVRGAGGGPGPSAGSSLKSDPFARR